MSTEFKQSKLNQLASADPNTVVLYKDDNMYYISNTAVYMFKGHPHFTGQYKVGIKNKNNPAKNYSAVGNKKPVDPDTLQFANNLLQQPAFCGFGLVGTGLDKFRAALHVANLIGPPNELTMSIEVRPDSVSFRVHSADPTDTVVLTLSTGGSQTRTSAATQIICGVDASVIARVLEGLSVDSNVVISLTEYRTLRITTTEFTAVVGTIDCFIRPL